MCIRDSYQYCTWCCFHVGKWSFMAKNLSWPNWAVHLQIWVLSKNLNGRIVICIENIKGDNLNEWWYSLESCIYKRVLILFTSILTEPSIDSQWLRCTEIHGIMVMKMHHLQHWSITSSQGQSKSWTYAPSTCTKTLKQFSALQCMRVLEFATLWLVTS